MALVYGRHSEATPEQRRPGLVKKYRQEIAQQHIHLTPAGRGVDQLQTDYASGLRLLVLLSALLLLIASANTANLLLARGSGRTVRRRQSG